LAAVRPAQRLCVPGLVESFHGRPSCSGRRPRQHVPHPDSR